MKELKPTPSAGAAIILFLCIILAFGLLDCRPVRINPEPITCLPSSEPPTVSQCEVEAPASPRIPLRTVAPDFWDPNYKNNRIVNVWVEVDSLFNTYHRPNTERVVRSIFDTVSKAAEREHGIRVVVVGVNIMTRNDIASRQTNANNMLFQFATITTNQPADIFKFRLSGRNIGGSAYISRGSVTSLRFAVCGFGNAIRGTSLAPGNLEYGIGHELLHGLGNSHSHNCCVWKNKAGQFIGRLDSCYQGERSCTPTPGPCNINSRRMPGGWNSYAHLWGTAGYWLHPSAKAVLNEALFYSNLPSYTPTTPNPQPIQPTWTFSGATLSGTTANVNDGNTDTRWVTTGRSSVTITYPDSFQVNTLRIVSGFLPAPTAQNPNPVWGSPIQPLRVLVNGSQVFSATSSKPDTTIRINRRAKSVVVEGNDPTNNRWREILIN